MEKLCFKFHQGHQEPRQDDPVPHPGVGFLMDWVVGVGHLDESETP